MTEPTAAPSPAADPRARGVFLAPNGLSVPRTAIAVGGASAALVAIVLGCPGLGAFGWIEAGLLAVAVGAMLLDRVDAHVFVRSVLWGVLFFGVMAVMNQSHGLADPWDQARAFTTLLGTGASLLSLGRAGLDGEHGRFFPIVMRRSLLTMMVVGVSLAHVMAVVAVVAAVDHRWAFGAVTSVTPVLLLLGVVGLSQTRTWGLLAYVGSIFAAAGTAALFVYAPELFGLPAGTPSLLTLLGALWAVFAFIALTAGLPVLLALVLKPRPRPAGKGWGQHVHAALVLGVVGLTLYDALS